MGITSVAFGDTGELSLGDCIEDNDVGPDACNANAEALEGIRKLAVSPDATSVYGASEADDAIAILDRDPLTGVLSQHPFIDCWDDDDTGDEGCGFAGGATTSGLDTATSVAVSPDGESVYVAAYSDDAVVAFDRSLATGSLAPIGCVDDNDFGSDPNQGPDTCSQTANGLDGAQGVAVSPDGESVYVASREDDAIVIFDRNTATGGITPLGCWQDNDTGGDTCSNVTNGMTRVRDLTVSPDGKSVYAASGLIPQDDNAIVHFHRDTSTGAFTAAECYDDNDTGTDTCLLAGQTDGLNGAGSPTVSPDGAWVYATGSLDDAIVRFTRDPGDGVLTPAGCIEDNDDINDNCTVGSVDGLDGAHSVTVSPDGRSLYASSFGDDAVVSFDRTTAGILTSIGCVDDNDFMTDPLQGPDACAQGDDGLNGTTGLAVTPDGKGVLAPGFQDSAVNRLFRDDDDPPGTTIVAGPAEGSTTTDSTPDFEFASTELLSTFECQINGAGFSACGAQYAPGPLSPGPYVLEVRAVDPSGNPDPSPATRSFSVVVVPAPVDATAPDTSVTGKSKVRTRKRKKRVSFTITSTEPGSSLECSVDGGPFSPCTSPFSTKLRRGTHRFAARATDAAGNQDASPATFTTKVKRKRRR